jgi:hypothetical protein
MVINEQKKKIYARTVHTNEPKNVANGIQNFKQNKVYNTIQSVQ